jgi:hypothetical protein
MNLRTRRDILAPRWGGFDPRLALLAALAGLAIGVALLQTGTGNDGGADDAVQPAAVATAGAAGASASEGVALTGDEGANFTEQQAQAARAATSADAPPIGTVAITGGEGEFFTGQTASPNRETDATVCGLRVDQIAC